MVGTDILQNLSYFFVLQPIPEIKRPAKFYNRTACKRTPCYIYSFSITKKNKALPQSLCTNLQVFNKASLCQFYLLIPLIWWSILPSYPSARSLQQLLTSSQVKPCRARSELWSSQGILGHFL